MVKHLDLVQRGKILGLHEAGWSARKIAKKLGCDRRTVDRILIKFAKTGSVNSLPKSGRPRKTSPRDDRSIVRSSLISRKTPATQLHLHLADKKRISVSTLRNRLSEVGLNGRVARKKPLLTLKQKKARLNWALKHKQWKEAEWERVLWSDESPFHLFEKGGKWVRRRIGEEFKEECISPTVKFGGGHINVWGCFSIHGKGDLHRIHGNMNGEMYKQILIHHMIPNFKKLPKNAIFMHDNDPKHTCNKVKRYLSNKALTVLP